MSREVRRIALDFDAPVGEVWSGYLNPYRNRAVKCSCVAEGRNGLAPRAHELYEKWWGYSRFTPEMNNSSPITMHHPHVAMLAQNNLRHSPDYYGLSLEEVEAFFKSASDLETSRCDASAEYWSEAWRLASLYNKSWQFHLNDNDIDILMKSPEALVNTLRKDEQGNWVQNDPLVRPTCEELQFSMMQPFSNSRVQHHLISGMCALEGVPYLCEICDGDIELWPSAEDRELYNNWEQPKPPSGPGFQLWSTVTEGTPNSPVFETPEALADFLVSPASPEKRGINKDLTRDEWLVFIKGEMHSVGSMTTSSAGFVTGVKAAIMLSEE
jgi:hypothetical protein